MATAYGKLFLYVRLFPGIVSIVIRAIKMFIKKLSSKTKSKALAAIKTKGDESDSREEVLL